MAGLHLPDDARTVQVSEKTLGLINGIALVVGLQIGSGIFSSPGVVVANTQSVGASLIVWALSGVLSWTGASSFAELGSAIPLNGGAQAYLGYAYGPLVAYLYTWTSILVLSPGSKAVTSLIFGEYLNRVVWNATRSEDSPADIPHWAIQLTALAAIAGVTLLCILTRSLSKRAAVIFTSAKVLALVAVTLFGLVQIARGRASSALRKDLFVGSATSASSYALALYSGLWAFDGWDQVSFVGGEMRRPEKNIPRAIHTSMSVVMVLFLLANVSYFAVLEKDVVGRSNTIALDFGWTLFGPVGGAAFALTVAVSCFGALNGSFFTAGRVVQAAGRRGYIPALFGRMHPTRGTPANAMLLQASITSAFVLLGGGFRALLSFAVIAFWAFYFLTVLGVVVLRFREPDLARPYKTWLITPITFCVVALFLLGIPVLAAPRQGVSIAVFVGAGVPTYFLTQRGARRSLAEEASEARAYGAIDASTRDS